MIRACTNAGRQVVRRNRAGAPRRRSGRRHLGDPLVQLLAHRLIGRGLHFAPVWKGGGDRGYSDLPVTAVEVRLAGGGIGLAGVVVLGHFLLLGILGSQHTALSVPGRLGGSVKWPPSTAEMRNKSCPIMTFRMPDPRWPLPPLWPAVMVKLGLKYLRLGIVECGPASPFAARLRGAFHSTGRNCGIPGTASEDY